VPTISDLKDQARGFEQQGQIDKALTIYQHILKHLEGNPAITKVLPLYVKAGDLLLKLDRTEEAVASYQTGAEQYASTGAATRVTALCEKIIRLAPERTDVYTHFVRLLIDNGHVGSARDVFAAYAQQAKMDRALETLNDLAGRPNNEVQPMLERLLDSFDHEESDDEAAERVSTHLEQVTDDFAGELTGVPEAEEHVEHEAEEVVEADDREGTDDGSAEPEHEEPRDGEGDHETEPLTPQLLDLDRMPRQSSIQKAITDEDLEEMTEEEEEEERSAEEDEERLVEEGSQRGITTNLTPTAESPQVESDFEDETQPEDFVASEEAPEEGKLDILLAESMTTGEVEEAEEAPDATESAEVEIERSQWTPDVVEPSAEETVAAEWSPEEELAPAARYPSDEYDTPEGVEEEAKEEAEEEESRTDALDDEIARAVEDSEAFALAAAEPEEKDEPDAPVTQVEVDHSAPAEMEPEPEQVQRRSRPPRMMLPDESEAQAKSPFLFAAGGFVVGLLVGAILTFILFGGSGSPPTAVSGEQQEATQTPTAETETPVVPETQVAEPPVVTPEAAIAETTAVQIPEEATMNSADLAPVEAVVDSLPAIQLDETPPDTAGVETPVEQETEAIAPGGNPIIVEGMGIDELSEIEAGGRTGFRVVHLLDWADPLVIEAYRDTTVTMSTFIQVTVTPPDTVVGIRRMDGYMVYASSVMPEDSLRSLMSRLAVGERPPN